MKIGITGAAGFVGSYLTSYLIKKGHKLRLLDTSIETLKELKDVEIIEGGVEDDPTVKSFVKGIEIIIHLAWSFSRDPVRSLEVDVKGTLNLLKESVEQKVQQFIIASTAEVYGKPVHVPLNEDDPCLLEESRKPIYALSKFVCEKLGLIFFKEQGLPVSIFRFWWTFGREIGGRHLREMIKQAIEGKELEVVSKAGGSFLYIDDLLKGFELSFLNQNSFGQVFNLSSQFFTWEEIAKIIVAEVGKGQVKIISRKDWKGSSFLVNEWNLSSQKAENLLGFKLSQRESDCRILLKEAIRRVVDKLRLA